MAENRIPVAAVVGPTATGKTELGIGLCQRLGGEVVSCEEAARDGKRVYQTVLAETLFFPEEGGQSPDQGTIDGLPGLDVQIGG